MSHFPFSAISSLALSFPSCSPQANSTLLAATIFCIWSGTESWYPKRESRRLMPLRNPCFKANIMDQSGSSKLVPLSMHYCELVQTMCRSTKPYISTCTCFYIHIYTSARSRNCHLPCRREQTVFLLHALFILDRFYMPSQNESHTL